MTAKIILILTLILIAGCGDSFEPYYRVSSTRLLAIASDRPDLVPGERTKLTALVPEIGGVAPSYHWSWCPFLAGGNVGASCAVPHEDLQAAVDEAVGPGLVVVPAYDLGTTPDAELTYELPPQLFQAICRNIRSRPTPALVELPKCERSFPLSVRLEIEAAGKIEVAIKEVHLHYEAVPEASRNHNPRLFDLELTLPGQGAAPMGQAGPIRRDVEHQVSAVLSSTAAETYFHVPPDGDGTEVATEETLILTWFVAGGTLDKTRKLFIEGETTFEESRSNLWTTPRTGDFAENEPRVWAVLRDGRGGTSWIERRVRLED